MPKISQKPSVCLYFQVHQPYRLKTYNFFHDEKDFFVGPEGALNRDIFEKVARKSYLPTNALMLELLQNYPEFKISFSLSGVFLEQCLEYGKIGKEVLESFQKLVKTGRVELLSETYYHSLTFLYSKQDYAEQILKHRRLIRKLFGVQTKVFRNTELIYNNELAQFIRAMGFSGMLLEGWDKVVGEQNVHEVHAPVASNLHPEDLRIAMSSSVEKPKKNFGLLLKNYKLSDDIAFRFGNKAWEEFPLTAPKYAHWLDSISGDTINLFMDYETFGEHQWEETGIFDFLRELPGEVLKAGITFQMPSETLQNYENKGEIDCHDYLSWADQERDLSAWTGNSLQDSALEAVFSLESAMHVLKKSKKKTVKKLVDAWHKLQTSDHFYYMCLKFWNDGDVHKYFSPYESPYEAYISFMNVFSSLKEQVLETQKSLNLNQNA